MNDPEVPAHRTALITAPEAAAVDVGAEILARGGNAVDAALACAFAQGVVNPHDSSVGGFLVLQVCQPGDPAGVRTLDAPATAGSRARPDMWATRFRGPNPSGWGYLLDGNPNEYGYGSICTPGAVRGFADAASRWGSMPLADLIEPAARLAEDGFQVDARIAAGWRSTPEYSATPLVEYLRSNREGSRVFLRPDGSPHDAGGVIRNPDYAATLRRIGVAGADAFYRGELAERMADDLAAGGAAVTTADLAAYRTRDVEPLVGTYRGWTITTSPPPHAGPTLIGILNILEGWDLRSFGHNSAGYILRVALAMKAAFADRAGLGDPLFVDVPLERMTSKDRSAEWRGRIERGEPIEADPVPAEAPGTTHVSVVDGSGMCVSLTHSLGGSSGVVTPGLGFMFNNSMANFHPLPGHANSIAPGKGRTTGLTPTIVARDGRPAVVVGAPGAMKIVTGVAQVIVNMLDFGMDAQAAIDAPRFDCHGGPIALQSRFPAAVLADVGARHPVVRSPYGHGGFGLVHAIGIDDDGRLSGGADAGAHGMAVPLKTAGVSRR